MENSTASTYEATTAYSAIHRTLLSICKNSALFMTPWMVVLCVLSNGASILVFARSPLGVAPSARVYYVWIAVFDTLTVLSKDVSFTLLVIALRYLHEPDCQWDALQGSSGLWTCRLAVYVYEFSEMCTNNAVVALSFERLQVLWWPFTMRHGQIKRCVVTLLCILCFAMLVACGFPVAAQVIYPDNPLEIPQCLAMNVPWAQLLVVLTYFFIYIFPTCTSSVLALVLVVKFRSTLLLSKSLQRKAVTRKLREYRLVIVTILLVLVNDLVLIPVGVLFATLTVAQVVAPENKALIGVLNDVFMAVYSFPIIAHSVNFLIYCVKIPGFRQEFLSVFKCSFPVHNS